MMTNAPNLRALRAYVAVMRHASVTQAAERLNISQPALSRLVAKCEAELGATLFQRERKRLVATELANSLLPEVERILAAHHDLPHLAAELSGGHRVTLRIAAAPRLAHGLVGQVIHRMRENGSLARFVIDSRERAEIESWVVSNTYDVGLASLPVTYDGVKILPFAEADATILMRRDDPLADAPHLTISDIADRDMIVTAPGSLLRERTISAFAEIGRSFLPRIEAATSPLAARFVAQGHGLFIYDSLSGTDQDDLLKMVPLRPGFAQRVGFLLPVGSEQSDIVQDFCKNACDVAREAGGRLL